MKEEDEEDDEKMYNAVLLNMSVHVVVSFRLLLCKAVLIVAITYAMCNNNCGSLVVISRHLAPSSLIYLVLFMTKYLQNFPISLTPAKH